MRKKVLAAVTLAAVLITGLGAALAAPNTDGDPFVTLSYLTTTYYAEAEKAMLQRAQSATAKTEQTALNRLDKLSRDYLAQADGGGEDSAGGGNHAGSFLRLSLSRGDQLSVPAGADLLFEAGLGDLSFSSGALVDVTDGSVVTDGGKLTAGHRYVAAENTACAFTVTTDAALLSVQGPYGLERTGTAQTPFTDLSSTDWYYSPVRFAYDNGLFQGNGTLFSPNTNMTRSMLATVLRRLAGVQGAAPSIGFTDVAADAWYADAVNWAALMGIVTGSGDGTFHPDSNVTREEMAVMLYRYAGNYMGVNVPATGDLSAFPDRAKVSSWAEEALSWAVGAGIITSRGDGTLGPGVTASRAEVATMLQRFSNFLV